MRWFLFLLLLPVILLGLFAITNGDTRKYVEKEALTICEWLNTAESEVAFRVGPLAFEHLKELKSKEQKYSCEATLSEHMYGYKDEMAVVISADGQVRIMLIYGLGLGGRNFYQPRYFQHWTGNKVRHHD